MNQNFSQLELLANETFIEIFQYFNIKELFQSFDNLNDRFNRLIRSLNNLIFKLYDDKSIGTYNFIPYVDNLIIYSSIYVNLKYFTNIRRLNLIQIPYKFLEQMNTEFLPCLEDLSIKKMSPDLAKIFYENIFYNCFPCLKSCYLSQDSEIPKYMRLTNLPYLYNLQIGIIDLGMYESILSVCLNLNFFKFKLKSNEISVNMKPHFNVKRMIIKPEDYIQVKNDYAINICLSFVPNLERLCIQQDFFQINIPYYLNSDWHASSIDHYIRSLCQFNYDLRVWYLTAVDLQIVNTIDDIKKKFQNIHNDRYQSQLRFKLVY